MVERLEAVVLEAKQGHTDQLGIVRAGSRKLWVRPIPHLSELAEPLPTRSTKCDKKVHFSFVF